MHASVADRTHAARASSDGTRVWALIAAALAVGLAAGASCCHERAVRDESSIGVLPFENRSGDTTQAYLSEGVSDEIAAQLSSVPELKVSPRSSTVHFRGSAGGAGRDRTETRRDISPDGWRDPAGRHGARERRTHRCSREAPALESGARGAGPLTGQLRGQRLARGDPVPRARGVPVASRVRAWRRATHWRTTTICWPSITGIGSLRRTSDGPSRTVTVPSPGTLPTRTRGSVVRTHCLRSRRGSAASPDARHWARYGRRWTPSWYWIQGRGSAHAIRGMVYTWFELDWDAADREFRQALALEPAVATSYQRAAFLQAARGHTDSALALSATAQTNGASQHPRPFRPSGPTMAGVIEQSLGHRQTGAAARSRLFRRRCSTKRYRSVPLVATVNPSRRPVAPVQTRLQSLRRHSRSSSHRLTVSTLLERSSPTSRPGSPRNRSVPRTCSGHTRRWEMRIGCLHGSTARSPSAPRCRLPVRGPAF